MDAAALLDTSPHAVLVLDPAGLVTYANTSACQLLGRTCGDTVGVALVQLVDGAHRRRVERLLAAVLGGSPGGPVHVRMGGPAERWISVRAVPAAEGGAQLGLADVTDRAEADRRLRRSEQRFRAAFEASPTATAIVDEDARFLRVNRALAELTGRPLEWFPGRSADEVTLPDDLDVNVTMARRLQDEASPVRATKRYQRPDGTVRFGVLTAVKVLGDSGESLTIAQIEDVTDRRRAEERLQRLALHDALTDLPGRGLLLDRLEQALADPDAVAVLFVDLDGFKLVNDALGHSVGDAVLVEVAARLLASVRPQDVVGRLGGDEFLVVCRDLDDRAEALAVAHRIEQALAEPVAQIPEDVVLSASVGIAFPWGQSSPADMVRDADAAMYRAKQLGKRRFAVFDDAMRRRIVERARLERLLQAPAMLDRLEVHYQPIVRLACGTVVAVEALARLRDDNGTLLLPEVFLAVAEDTGLVGALDDAVRQRAVREIARLRADLGVDLALTVNVSAARVTPDLPSRVAADLAASGFPATDFALEITEQTLIDRGPAAERALRTLADSGVHLAIDDFGTGWASLTYLRRFPIAAVKVDRSFVAGINDAHQDQVIVRAVVNLARELGLNCTVEGVETAEQARTLNKLGANHGQGWLFGRPLPYDALRGDLSQRDVRR